jgi:hypothetical protein
MLMRKVHTQKPIFCCTPRAHEYWFYNTGVVTVLCTKVRCLYGNVIKPYRTNTAISLASNSCHHIFLEKALVPYYKNKYHLSFLSHTGWKSSPSQGSCLQQRYIAKKDATS